MANLTKAQALKYIEDGFKKSIRIHFQATPPKTMGYVALIFKDSYECANEYQVLLDVFSTVDNTMTINRRNNSITVSIVETASKTKITIENPNYDEDNLNTFLSTYDEKIGFLFAFAVEGKTRFPALIDIGAPFLIIQHYELVQ